tara:strand:+ start:576 stop:761 length:186 start_codon:yes stop_codon:yes gene_type:complete
MCRLQCIKYGEQFIFGKNLNLEFGEGTSEELYLKAKQIIKFSNNDLEDLITKYNSLINDLN